MSLRLFLLACSLLMLLCPFMSTAQQACSTLGQTPQSAFPLCTRDTFFQSSVPICTNKKLVVPGCPPSTGDYADKNPFWYRFTCYQTGTLSLLITPNNLNDDYDWQLYDITGITDLNRVYTDANLFVVGNWSGSSGKTGASAAGTNVVECASDPRNYENTFSRMPVITVGHTYLLLVSHYSDSQSGYSISFAGGSAVINEQKLPDLQKLQPSCDATVLALKLNMRMLCNSISPDGSDFVLIPANATIVAASGIGCTGGFDTDSIQIVLSNPLPPGSYQLAVKTGKDNNTILDDCERDIPVGNKIPFTITPPQPTLPDSIGPVKCAPQSIDIYFPKKIRCGSIAADGSDFQVSGPAPIAVTGASEQCVDGQTSVITLRLATPAVHAGTYTVQIKKGSDGNNVIDECGQETPTGSSVSFSVKDTVSADFNYQLLLGCKADTIVFHHNAANGVNQWFWLMAEAGAGTTQNVSAVFTVFGTKQISLVVSNGFCADTVTKAVSLTNTLKASFETNALLCPEDTASFLNTSVGNIIGNSWSFGDGSSSALPSPGPKKYPATGTETNYPVQLVVENDLHCFDTAVNTIKVLRSCYIAVPNAFTPNNDGINDYLYPLNALKADNLEFNVYNRFGQRIFHTTDWTKKWDGTLNGRLQSADTYVWTLRYTNHDTGKRIFLKGTTVLIR